MSLCDRVFQGRSVLRSSKEADHLLIADIVGMGVTLTEDLIVMPVYVEILQMLFILTVKIDDAAAGTMLDIG